MITKKKRIDELTKQLEDFDKKPLLRYNDIREKEFLREKIQWLTREYKHDEEAARISRMFMIFHIAVGFIIGAVAGIASTVLLMSLVKQMPWFQY